MSVSFHCPDAPVRTVIRPCDLDGCTPDERCGYCEDGVLVEVVRELPEINLANANARAMLRLLGLEDEYLGGQLAPGAIPAVRQRILRLRNSARARSSAVRLAVDDGRVHEGGLSDDSVLDRLERLDELLAEAQRRGWSVAWE